MEAGIFLKGYELLQSKDPLLALQILMSHDEEGSLADRRQDLTIPQETKVLYLIDSVHPEMLIALDEWLERDKEHFVIVCETSLSALKALFTCFTINKLLHCPRFFLHYIQKDQWECYVQKLAWMTALLKSHIIYGEGCLEADKLFYTAAIRHVEDAIFCLVSDWLDYGVLVTKNLYKHALNRESFKLASHLKGAFSGIPAIIVGAGASIKNELEHFKQLKDKALIFAGGSALAHVSAEAIDVHIGGYIDPSPHMGIFKQQMYMQLPMLIAPRLDGDIASFMQGDLLYFHDNSGYPLEDFLFEKGVFTEDKEEWGWNVGNVITKWALEMGCDPVILVGMDMAYEAKDKSIKGDEELIITKNGNHKITRKDFLMGERFFKELKERYPKRELLHVAHDGLPLEGIEVVELCHVVERFKTTYDLKGLLHERLMQACHDERPHEKMISKLIAFQTSALRAQSILREMMLIIEGKQEGCISSKIALQEVELEEELFFKVVLEPMWQRLRFVLLRERCQSLETPQDKLMKIITMYKAAFSYSSFIETIR